MPKRMRMPIIGLVPIEGRRRNLDTSAVFPRAAWDLYIRWGGKGAPSTLEELRLLMYAYFYYVTSKLDRNIQLDLMKELERLRRCLPSRLRPPRPHVLGRSSSRHRVKR